MLLDILGAGALLIWALRMVKTGITRAFGARIHYWLGAATNNRVQAFFAGWGATLAVQSSTATALIAASFAGREFISIPMAQAVMLGANVGSSITARILALDIHWLSPAFLLVGVAVFTVSQESKKRAIGRALIGVGLMLLSLHLLVAATTPMRDSESVRRLLLSLADAPFIAMLVASGLSIVASSSLATILFIMSFASAADIAPQLLIALVLGANLGGAVPPLLATTGQGSLARRVTLGNLLVRLIGCLLVLPFLGAVADLLSRLSQGQSEFVVNAHMCFSAGLALIFLPLLNLVSRVTGYILPAAKDTARGPRHLDPALLNETSLAISCATREAIRIGDIVELMLTRSRYAFDADDQKIRAEISKLDDEVDRLQSEITLYLTRLDSELLSADERRRCAEITSFVINLEHAGDIIDKNLMGLVNKKIGNRLRFSKEGHAEIIEFFGRTVENLRAGLGLFLSRDINLARRLVESKVDVRSFERLSAERHLARLGEGRIESLATSTVHLDLLRDLKRVNAHIVSIAYLILEDIGDLRESRLIAEG
jgi:phosphate:Na+ symporter